jgi:hypothetical protein
LAGPLPFRLSACPAPSAASRSPRPRCGCR